MIMSNGDYKCKRLGIKIMDCKWDWDSWLNIVWKFNVRIVYYKNKNRLWSNNLKLGQELILILALESDSKIDT